MTSLSQQALEIICTFIDFFLSIPILTWSALNERAGFTAIMRQLMYPSNLDLSLFGKDAEKVTWITDRIYRGGEYADSNGFLCHNLHYPVSVSMERLREYSGVSNPARIIDLICRSDRHQQYGRITFYDADKERRYMRLGVRDEKRNFWGGTHGGTVCAGTIGNPKERRAWSEKERMR